MLTTALFYALVILQLADIATTHYALRTGKAREANCGMAWLMARIGVLPALIVTKAIFVALACYMLRFDNVGWALGALCVLYGWVVFNNFKVIKTAAKRGFL